MTITKGLPALQGLPVNYFRFKTILGFRKRREVPMKVAIIGGGPAGLYSAILLKKQRPEADVTVYERNRADDTFGFGVVFSDATLDNFEKYDPPSYRRITQEFAYWDDIAVHFRGTVHRVGGNGFCGCSRRQLLLILQERARELGVRLNFETEIADEARFADADLVVLADGINSRFREKHAAHFEPEVDLRSNVFAWMGSTRPLDAFTFIFQETEWGPFIAHAYQYEVGRSTWIFETDPETFKRAGLTGLNEKQSADRMGEIFGWFLEGHPLLTNRSMWRNFPMIRSQRWVKDNMVLLGDAKATAHFSIGSGTKLAMEDAIALADAMERAPTVQAALVTYEQGRREEVEKTQHAADVSLVWFEHVDRFWDFDPVQFALGGAGLIFTEMTCVGRDARITPGCTGLWNDEQEKAWRRIVDFVHANSAAKICLQLGHAGRKGATKLMWDGMDRPLDQGGWDVVSASPIPYFPDSQVPREMDRAAMDAVKAEFVAASQRGEACGFDMLELHCAHGYLLASFISPLTNQRTDEYGGSLENRLRYPLEIFEAMRSVWPSHKPMSVRISATDWAEGGITGDDAVAVARAFAERGVDLVDVSTGQTVRDAQPIYGRMFQTPFSDQVRNEARVATMCVGNITTSDQVNTILAAGRADLVALGRPHLVDPAFTIKAAAWYGANDTFCPPQYLPGKEQIFRNSVRDRQDFEELKIKAKPKTRAELKAEATKPLAAE
jgi:2,4-dienoyl-CoA reductase-like NADH-dependent reductase (Old Yellow Enzyme family)/2-polyprenyl-6-methoxyphenol hydroxylase-like FAD-dependent oxidoreductase